MKKNYFLFTIIFALLGINQAWGDECYVYEDSEGGNVTAGSYTDILETPIFENADGIDGISFTYNAPGNSGIFGSTKGGIKILYSLDGSSYKDWPSEKGEGSNRYLDLSDEMPADAKNAVRFKFQTRGTNGYHAVWGIKIHKCPTVKLDVNSHEFHKTAVGATLNHEFIISTYNVTENLSIVKSGTNVDYFSYELSEASGSCPTMYTLTVTYSPEVETTGEETHTASFAVSANEKTATLNVSGTASALVNPAYTWKGEGSYLIESEALNLNTLWTSSSPADKVYTIKSWTPEEGVPTAGATAPTLNAGVLTLGQAGTLVLKVAQDETAGYTDGSTEQEVIINRRKAAFTWYSGAIYRNSVINNFWSSTNTETEVDERTSSDEVATIANAVLTTYYAGGALSVTIEQAENYKWEAKNETKEYTVGTQFNHLDLEITEENYDNKNLVTPHVSSGRFRWNGGGILLGSKDVGLSEVEGWDYRSFDIEFTGIPDTLSFYYEKSISTASGMNWYVAESVDKITWDTTWHRDGGDNGTLKMQLKPTTRNVRIIGWMNYGSRFKNIKITERHEFAAENVDFGQVLVGSDEVEKELVFKHANAGYNVSVELNEEGETKHFAIDHLTVDNTGGDRWGEEIFVITYNPSELGDHTATVTFTDLLGNEKVVTISGKTVATIPTGIDETEVVKATKIMRNGQIFIIREGKVYNLQGLRVE